MSASKRKHVVSSIRQLCCLGLPEETAVPRLLESLHRLADSESNHFIWSDTASQPTNYYGEHFYDSTVHAFFSGIAWMSEAGVYPGFAGLVASDAPITAGADNGREYLNSAIYNEVLKPLDGRFVLSVPVRDARRAYGALVMLRAAATSPFDAREIREIADIASFIRHALGDKADAAGAGCDELDCEAFAVLAEDGRLLHIDQDGRRLLFLATHPEASMASREPLDASGMSQRIARVCRELTGIFRGRGGRPPRFENANRWGRFVFRARWLQAVGAAREGRIGLTISHYVPRRLKLWQSIAALELPPRLQQVALEFADGASLNEVADRLGIRRNTAIDYVQNIYARLGIEPDKHALRSYLLDGGEAGPPLSLPELDGLARLAARPAR